MLNALDTWSPMTVTVKVAKPGTWKVVFTFAVSESPGNMVDPPEISVMLEGGVHLKWFVKEP